MHHPGFIIIVILAFLAAGLCLAQPAHDIEPERSSTITNGGLQPLVWPTSSPADEIISLQSLESQVVEAARLQDGFLDAGGQASAPDHESQATSGAASAAPESLAVAAETGSRPDEENANPGQAVQASSVDAGDPERSLEENPAMLPLKGLGSLGEDSSILAEEMLGAEERSATSAEEQEQRSDELLTTWEEDRLSPAGSATGLSSPGREAVSPAEGVERQEGNLAQPEGELFGPKEEAANPAEAAVKPDEEAASPVGDLQDPRGESTIAEGLPNPVESQASPEMEVFGLSPPVQAPSSENPAAVELFLADSRAAVNHPSYHSDTATSSEELVPPEDPLPASPSPDALAEEVLPRGSLLPDESPPEESMSEATFPEAPPHQLHPLAPPSDAVLLEALPLTPPHPSLLPDSTPPGPLPLDLDQLATPANKSGYGQANDMASGQSAIVPSLPEGGSPGTEIRLDKSSARAPLEAAAPAELMQSGQDSWSADEQPTGFQPPEGLPRDSSLTSPPLLELFPTPPPPQIQSMQAAPGPVSSQALPGSAEQARLEVQNTPAEVAADAGLRAVGSDERPEAGSPPRGGEEGLDEARPFEKLQPPIMVLASNSQAPQNTWEGELNKTQPGPEHFLTQPITQTPARTDDSNATSVNAADFHVPEDRYEIVARNGSSSLLLSGPTSALENSGNLSSLLGAAVEGPAMPPRLTLSPAESHFLESLFPQKPEVVIKASEAQQQAPAGSEPGSSLNPLQTASALNNKALPGPTGQTPPPRTPGHLLPAPNATPLSPAQDSAPLVVNLPTLSTFSSALKPCDLEPGKGCKRDGTSG